MILTNGTSVVNWNVGDKKTQHTPPAEDTQTIARPPARSSSEHPPTPQTRGKESVRHPAGFIAEPTRTTTKKACPKHAHRQTIARNARRKGGRGGRRVAAYVRRVVGKG